MSLTNVRGLLFANHTINLAVNGEVDAIFIDQVVIFAALGSSQLPELAASKIRQFMRSGCLAAKLMAHGPPPE